MIDITSFVTPFEHDVITLARYMLESKAQVELDEEICTSEVHLFNLDSPESNNLTDSDTQVSLKQPQQLRPRRQRSLNLVNESHSHTLYRMFNADEKLLYIGLTKNPSDRFTQHSRDKHWWSDVSVIRVEHFATRRDLMNAEAKAIKYEKPIHNIVHNGEINLLQLGFDDSPPRR